MRLPLLPQPLHLLSLSLALLIFMASYMLYMTASPSNDPIVLLLPKDSSRRKGHHAIFLQMPSPNYVWKWQRRVCNIDMSGALLYTSSKTLNDKSIRHIMYVYLDGLSKALFPILLLKCNICSFAIGRLVSMLPKNTLMSDSETMFPEASPKNLY